MCRKRRKTKFTRPFLIWGGGFTCAVVKAAYLESRRLRVSNPTLAFKFKRNKLFLPHSLSKIQYYGEHPWPRGSVLGRQGSNFESCVWRAVSSHSSFIISRFSCPSLAYNYVHKSGKKIRFISFLP